MTDNERLRRARAFAGSGAIGVYDADDLHADMRYLVSEVERLNSLIEDIHAAYENSAAYKIGSALIRGKED